MEVIDYTAKMRRILELNRIAEQDYARELKVKNPSITEDEIKVEVQKRVSR